MWPTIVVYSPQWQVYVPSWVPKIWCKRCCLASNLNSMWKHQSPRRAIACPSDQWINTGWLYYIYTYTYTHMFNKKYIRIYIYNILYIYIIYIYYIYIYYTYCITSCSPKPWQDIAGEQVVRLWPILAFWSRTARNAFRPSLAPPIGSRGSTTEANPTKVLAIGVSISISKFFYTYLYIYIY